jgi:hypothetical protein
MGEILYFDMLGRATGHATYLSLFLLLLQGLGFNPAMMALPVVLVVAVKHLHQIR